MHCRVVIVNSSGNVLLDEYVKPVEPITDYRTKFSGEGFTQLHKASMSLSVQLLPSPSYRHPS
jgi:hypothetical protein